MSLRPSGFYILCYIDLWTFRQKSFRPLDISYKCHFDLRNVRSRLCDFDHQTFPFVISTLSQFTKSHFNFGHFVPMSFRTLDFPVSCQFDLRTFRSYVISTSGHFTNSQFDLLTFRSNVISNFGFFGFMSFRPSDFSILCYFDLMS